MQHPFICNKPKTLGTPLIYNSPHSGRIYENKFLRQAKLGLKEIRVSEDFYVDRLLDCVTDYGSVLMQACFPRSFVDVNRSQHDLDQRLIKKLNKGRMSSRTSAGLGVIPRIVGDGVEIYDKKLSLEEVKTRLDLCYFPYHEQLQKLITNAIETFGVAVLVDMHSMPHSSLDHLKCDSLRTPEIVLGDCFGSSCSPNFSQIVYELFVSEGFSVKKNNPFSGGFITKNYGVGQPNVQAIQIEIDRSLYMDEKSFKLHDGFSELKKRIQKIAWKLSKTQEHENYLFQAAE